MYAQPCQKFNVPAEINSAAIMTSWAGMMRSSNLVKRPPLLNMNIGLVTLNLFHDWADARVFRASFSSGFPARLLATLLLPGKRHVIPRLFVADVPDYRAHQFFIVGDGPGFDVVTDHVAKRPAEIFMAAIAHE